MHILLGFEDIGFRANIYTKQIHEISFLSLRNKQSEKNVFEKDLEIYSHGTNNQRGYAQEMYLKYLLIKTKKKLLCFFILL